MSCQPEEGEEEEGEGLVEWGHVVVVERSRRGCHEDGGGQRPFRQSFADHTAGRHRFRPAPGQNGQGCAADSARRPLQNPAG